MTGAKKCGLRIIELRVQPNSGRGRGQLDGKSISCEALRVSQIGKAFKCNKYGKFM
jgi:hypothetical protein